MSIDRDAFVLKGWRLSKKKLHKLADKFSIDKTIDAWEICQQILRINKFEDSIVVSEDLAEDYVFFGIEMSSITLDVDVSQKIKTLTYEQKLNLKNFRSILELPAPAMWHIGRVY